MRKSISILLILAFLLAGCSNTAKPEALVPGSTSASEDIADLGEETISTEPGQADFSQTDGDMFTERDGRTAYDASKAVTIQLCGTTATASSDSVQISGSTVIIKEEATYVICGSLNLRRCTDACGSGCGF